MIKLLLINIMIGLCKPQFMILAFFIRNQGSMISKLHDFSPIKYCDVMAEPAGGKPMGDEDRCLVFHQGLKL